MTATAVAKKAAKVVVAHPLAHLVPDMLFAEEYVSRKIQGVRDTDLLRYAKAARNNVMLFGPTGPGKTSLILAYCAVEGIPLVTVQSNGAVDPTTFWGGWVPKSNLDAASSMDEFLKVLDEVRSRMPKGTPDDALVKIASELMERSGLVWQDSEITEVIRHGGVLYLDEVNFLPPKVAAVFHGLLDKRRQITLLENGNQVIKAHDDLQVVVAYNPDYEGTKPLNAAFKNRFKIKMRFDYDEAVERELVCCPVMLNLAAKLRLAHKSGDLETPVSTNMLIEFEELAVDLGYGFAVQNFLNAFAEDERQAVTEAFDLHAEQIKKEIAQMEAMANAD